MLGLAPGYGGKVCEWLSVLTIKRAMEHGRILLFFLAEREEHGIVVTVTGVLLFCLGAQLQVISTLMVSNIILYSTIMMVTT